MLFLFKQVYVLLMLVGGILLGVGLVTPWYYLSTKENTKEQYYSMSAMGGSLLDALDTEFFNYLAAYISLCFAIVSILFSFASTKLSEVSQRKYVAVVSLLTGICALMNIVSIHSWLGSVFPGIPFSGYSLESSWGPTIGYFLTWAAVALLLASTFSSKGLTQIPLKADVKEQ